MFKVIMAPTDGSDFERPALALAVRLARHFGAELRLVRVETPPFVVEPGFSPGVLTILEQTAAEARIARLGELDALAAECRAQGEIRVVTALESGAAAPTLMEHARRHEVDLIVMSSHARGGIKRLTLGSVTDYLIRRADIPVVIAKPSVSSMASDPGATFNRILVPLDGSVVAEQILPMVAALASRMNATVNLVFVLTPMTHEQKEIMQPGLPWWDEDIAIANACLERAATYLATAGLSVGEDVILSDDVVSAILNFGARIDTDLIAIATRGAGGVSRLLFGGIADELTRKSETSLLVFHPQLIAAHAGHPDGREASNHVPVSP